MATTTQSARLRDALLGAGIPREDFRVRVTEKPRGTYHASRAFFSRKESERLAAEKAEELAAAGCRVQTFVRNGSFSFAVISCGGRYDGTITETELNGLKEDVR